MSVVRSERAVSELEFLNNARKLEIFTIQKCVNAIPKRYTFFIANKLADSATAVYSYVKKGNSIYPINAHEVQIRRDYFLRAHAELQSLVSQLEIAYEIVHFDMKILKEWAKLINDEIMLIKAVIKKDKERYKNLK